MQVRAKAKLVWTLPSAAEIHLVISEGNSSWPCVCASRNNFAAGKGVESDVRQVQVCLACFSGATWQILPASGCAQDGAGVKSRKKSP